MPGTGTCTTRRASATQTKNRSISMKVVEATENMQAVDVVKAAVAVIMEVMDI